MPPWVTSLPAELRDHFVNGNLDKLPPRYKRLVQRYMKWLSQQRNR